MSVRTVHSTRVWSSTESAPSWIGVRCQRTIHCSAIQHRNRAEYHHRIDHASSSKSDGVDESRLHSKSSSHTNAGGCYYCSYIAVSY